MANTKIEVTVHRCQDIPRMRLLGTQDPYVVVQYGTQEFRTKTCEDGGTAPTFNETLMFVVSKGESTVLRATIMNDKRFHDGVIGTARIDFVLALEQGKIHKAFPVIDAHGKPQGLIEVTVKDIELMHTIQAADQVKNMELASAVDSHNQALVEARARYYADIKTQMAPQEKVTSAMGAEHMASTKAVQGEEEKEMSKVFDPIKPQVEELIDDASEELGKLTKSFLHAFPASLDQEDPSAKETFGRSLSTLNQLVDEAGAKRAALLARAKSTLTNGIEDLLAKYRTLVMNSYDDYESDFNGALFRYKGEVEAHYRRVAERKSQEQADRMAPLPAGAQAAAAAPPAAALYPMAPQPSHQAPLPRPAPVPGYKPYPAPAPQMAPAPMVYTDPAPQMAPAPMVYTDPAPQMAPAPMVYTDPAPYRSGVPMTQAERATQEAQAANAAASYARAEADAANRQAQMAQQQMQQQEQQMEEQEQQQRAVRRGVVGGLILARALR